MTIKQFKDKWNKNINSEYIIPDVENLIKDNIIIPNYMVMGNETYKDKVFINGEWYKIKIKSKRGVLNESK